MRINVGAQTERATNHRRSCMPCCCHLGRQLGEAALSAFCACEQSSVLFWTWFGHGFLLRKQLTGGEEGTTNQTTATPVLAKSDPIHLTPSHTTTAPSRHSQHSSVSRWCLSSSGQAATRDSTTHALLLSRPSPRDLFKSQTPANSTREAPRSIYLSKTADGRRWKRTHTLQSPSPCDDQRPGEAWLRCPSSPNQAGIVQRGTGNRRKPLPQTESLFRSYTGGNGNPSRSCLNSSCSAR